MSIIKFKPAVLNNSKDNRVSYTDLPNHVLQNCRNPIALAVWCYLQSKPKDWKVCPKNIQNHFGIGRQKAYATLRYLIDAKLLEHEQPTNQNGTFATSSYTVQNGDTFLPAPQNLIPLSKNHHTAQTQADQPRASFQHTEKQPVDNFVKPCASLPYAGSPYTANGTTTNTRAFTKTREIKKTRRGEEPVPVFFDHETVKSHIDKLTEQRQQPLEEQIVLQGVYYAYETNPDKTTESILKRINIFLKKVREGQWLIPQGFEGITSQSIREKEQQRQAEKKAEYEQDKIAIRAIVQASSIPGFKEMLAKLKGKSSESYNRRMQKANGQIGNEAPSPA